MDPTVGGGLKLIGYDEGFATIPSEGGPVPLAVRRVPGWRRTWFHERCQTVGLPRCVEIDLGATAKALAAELRAVRQHGARDGCEAV